ncbi:MAG: hypothetical protein ACOYL8_00540 [Patescibacteria group bacterium]
MIIFVLGQIIDRFLIKPIFDQKQIIGEILDALIFYANIYSNPYTTGDQSKHDDASHRIRGLASSLLVKTNLVPGYKLLSKLRVTIKRDNISKAHTELIRLSNSLYSHHSQVINIGMQNSDTANTIKKYLNNNFN